MSLDQFNQDHLWNTVLSQFLQCREQRECQLVAIGLTTTLLNFFSKTLFLPRQWPITNDQRRNDPRESMLRQDNKHISAVHRPVCCHDSSYWFCYVFMSNQETTFQIKARLSSVVSYFACKFYFCHPRLSQDIFIVMEKKLIFMTNSTDCCLVHLWRNTPFYYSFLSGDCIAHSMTARINCPNAQNIHSTVHLRSPS